MVYMASMMSLSVSSSPLLRPTLSFPSSLFNGTSTISLGTKTLTFSPLQKHLHIKAKKPLRVEMSEAAAIKDSENARFRLNNLAPQPGSRKRAKRKGRGTAAGQGNSCGFGMRGQKSRSGPGVMRGFEGGQMPLYRRLPKLRGIAGGMRVGLPKYVPVNLRDIATAGFEEGEEVSLETLKERGLINPSGRERRLPLKILGEGELSVKLNFKARAFSESAKEKLEAAGCSITVLPGRKKWVKPSVAKNLARAEEYFAKKRAAAAAAAATEPAST